MYIRNVTEVLKVKKNKIYELDGIFFYLLTTIEFEFTNKIW